MLMPNATKQTVLSVQGLTKSYGNSIHALRGIDIEVKEGEFLVILARAARANRR
jgi:ABC-type multidrug transport system ATPase subunit